MSSGVGLFVLLLNFPKLTTRAVNGTFEDASFQAALLLPVAGVQASVNRLVELGPQLLFQNLMATNYLILWVFVALVIAFAIRHWDARLIGYGVGGFILGFVALHLVSWVVVTVITVVGGVFGAIAWVMEKVYAFISFIFVNGWWLFLVVGVGTALYVFRQYFLKVLLGVGAVVAIAYTLYHFVPLAWRWFLDVLQPVFRFVRGILMEYILPVGAFAWKIMRWALYLLFVLLVVFGVLSSLGQLLIDQIRTARMCGAGRKNIALGAFAIGTALALVMLASVAQPGVATALDAGWGQSIRTMADLMRFEVIIQVLGAIHPSQLFVASMPSAVRDFVFAYLTSAPAPVIDALILLLVVVLAILSIIKGMIARLDEKAPRMTDFFLPKAFLGIVFGLFGGVIVVFAQGITESE